MGSELLDKRRNGLAILLLLLRSLVEVDDNCAAPLSSFSRLTPSSSSSSSSFPNQ